MDGIYSILDPISLIEDYEARKEIIERIENMERIGAEGEVEPPAQEIRDYLETDGYQEYFYLSYSDNLKTNPSTPKPIPCEYCGRLRYHKYFPAMRTWAPYGPEPCICQEAQDDLKKEQEEREAAEEKRREEKRIQKRRERIAKLRDMSGMSILSQGKTFQNFSETPENQTAFNFSKGIAVNFQELMPVSGEDNSHNGLYLYGNPGVGKSHLSMAIANYLLDRCRPVICMTFVDMLAEIRSSFDSSEKQEYDILSSYSSVDLLIIDDVGKENPSSWAVTTLYDIINRRYQAELPTVMTSNYSMDMLKRRMENGKGEPATVYALIDRMHQMMYELELKGKSWRTRKEIK